MAASLWASPEQIKTQCVRYRYRYSDCHNCTEACPHEAISLNDEGAELDTTRCRSCGLCDVACPTGTFRSEGLPNIAQLRDFMRRKSVSFACAPGGGEGDFTVPCLGAIGPVPLAMLTSMGVEVRLLGSHHCADCEHGSTGEALVQATIEALNELESGLELAESQRGRCVVVDEAPANDRREEYLASRRAFFRRVLGEAEAHQDDEGPAEKIPEQAIRISRVQMAARLQLLNLLIETRGRAGGRIEPKLLLFTADAAIDKKACTMCEACARVCPTGSMDIEESTKHWTLSFDPARCVGCAVCVEACQHDALAIGAREWDEFDEEGEAEGERRTTRRALYARSKIRCSVCDRPFIFSGGDDERCPTCGQDDDMFSQIFG